MDDRRIGGFCLLFDDARSILSVPLGLKTTQSFSFGLSGSANLEFADDSSEQIEN
jgi:hypothetical protein